jgi:hypothetical protein
VDESANLSLAQGDPANKKRVLQYQWSRKTRCNRILERFLLVEQSSATPKRTLYSDMPSFGIFRVASFAPVSRVDEITECE